MEKANQCIYGNYGADGSGYYTDNGLTAFIYIQAATPIVLEALRTCVALVGISTM